MTAAFLAGVAQAQSLSEWVLTGEPGNQPSTPASGAAPGVSGLDLVRGAGINPSSAANSFSGTAWHTLGADDYFSFGLLVDPGLEVVLDELWISTRSSNTGPGFLGLFHSGDGFAQSLHTFVQSGAANLSSVVDLGSLGPLSGLIEFRVRALDDTSAGGGTVSAAGAFRFADHLEGSSASPVRLTGQVRPTGSLVEPFCFGDGSGMPCPCGNAGSAGAGCANGLGGGARLSALGSPSVSAGDLVLAATGLVPGQPGLYFQGAARENGGAGVTFGDGLRCTGPAGVQLQIVTADGSGDSATSLDLAVAGSLAAGHTAHYQVWYRDPLFGLCGTGFNSTNGLSVIWVP